MQQLEKLQNAKSLEDRTSYIYQKERFTNERITAANQAKQQGDIVSAKDAFQQALRTDHMNSAAAEGLKKIEEMDQISSLTELAKSELKQGHKDQALHILKEVLRTAPNDSVARKLRFDIERDQNRQSTYDPSVTPKLNKRVSLEFRSASVQAVLELLAQSSGINFIMDKDVRTDDIKTTIHAKDTTVQEALRFIMKTSGLSYKILNANTFLIYSDSSEKHKNYDELLTRSFYLASADVQKTQDMIKILYAPKAMFFDERLRMLIVRDTQDVLDSIDLLLQAYDLPVPEVILDVEILEVNRDKLLGLGIDFPNQIGVRALTGAGQVGQYTINQIKSMTRDNLSLVVADPLATLNFKQTSAETNLLANPRIRVKSKEKANILIGDKVPVITTTSNLTSGSVSESINYLDVGLKLDVEPEVNKDRQVTIGIKLEVSNIAKEIRSSTGLVAYQIGTRNAATTLQLQDGETQMLAGLIRDDSQTNATHLPGLGKIPFLGRLFSNTTDSSTKSEIVLLITPHIVRPFALPAAHVQEFSSGTGVQVSTHPLRLSESSDYRAKPDNTTNIATATEAAPQSADTTPSDHDTDVTPTAIPAETTSPAMGMADISLNQGGSGSPQMQIQLNGPTHVTPGQDFTVALLQTGPAYESMSFDLLHDKSLELVRAVLIAPSNKFDQQAIEKGIRFTFGKTAVHQGTAALITFKVAKDAPSSELILSRGSIQLRDGQQPQGFSLDEHKPITVVR
ncbi:hypothetical protein [Aquirhabdus parva]|nr:hypothetical protein [Aquirhabdus parva]